MATMKQGKDVGRSGREVDRNRKRKKGREVGGEGDADDRGGGCTRKNEMEKESLTEGNRRYFLRREDPWN